MKTHTRSHFTELTLCVLGAWVRLRGRRLLTSKLDPPQDEEDEDGNEDYGDACTNHHPHHLKGKEQKVKRELYCRCAGDAHASFNEASYYLINMLAFAKCRWAQNCE